MAIAPFITKGLGNENYNSSIPILLLQGLSIGEPQTSLTSEKDTFEPDCYAGDTFAAGTLRGVGPFVGTGQPVRGWTLKPTSNVFTLPQQSNVIELNPSSNVTQVDQ